MNEETHEGRRFSFKLFGATETGKAKGDWRLLKYERAGSIKAASKSLRRLALEVQRQAPLLCRGEIYRGALLVQAVTELGNLVAPSMPAIPVKTALRRRRGMAVRIK